MPSRRVPFKIKAKLKETLDEYVKQGIIAETKEASEWVSNLVCVEKPNGDLRLCIDPQYLNKYLVRDFYEIPKLEDIKRDIAGKKYFAVLDIKSGFHHLVLDSESSKICTFSTPYGCYQYLRAPMGLNVIPEMFSKRVRKYFSNVQGVTTYMDDILCYADTKPELDSILKTVVSIARKYDIHFNSSKFQYCTTSVKYVGSVFSNGTIKADPDRVKSVCDLPSPQTKKELQTFLGMVNFVRDHIPNLSELISPMRELLKTNVIYQWNTLHENNFQKIKMMLCKSTELYSFDFKKPVVIQADASKDAVGGCLLQEGRPVAFVSRCLSETECNYAMVEKELLAIVVVMTKLHDYIYGHDNVTVFSDHQPLVTIASKDMCNIKNHRLKRLKLKLFPYKFELKYLPGKYMYIADYLSRSFVKHSQPDDDSMTEIVHVEQELAIHTNMFFRSLNASDKKLEEIENFTKNDPVLYQVIQYVQNGWPSHKNKVNKIVLPFFMYRNDLHVVNNILFKGSAIVVPTDLQSQLLKDAHVSHMGYNKTKNFVRNIFFWPSLFDDLKFTVQNCQVCQKYMPSNCKEPLIPHEVPRYPWAKVAVDLFDFEKSKYLIIVDYYSKFFEIVLLSSSTSQIIIKHLKSIFSRQGVPAQLISDGGPPFSSKDLQSFYSEWNIEHKCSSPYYPKSNGLVEQTVKIIKNTLYKCREDGTDPYLAMLHLRNSCADGQETPAKLLNARNLRTNLPTLQSQLRTSPVSYHKYKSMNEKRIESMKTHYDKSAKSLPTFKLGDKVLFQKKPQDVWLPAIVSKLPHELKSYRAYEIKTSEGRVYIRNRI
ncbi:hypothetical protein WDU94_012172 [Cyamophila willieti]